MKSAEEYLALFRKYDDPVYAESPPGFDRAGAIARFREFAAELSRRAETEYMVETELLIQDASFHSQIFLSGGDLRFSSFGEMITFGIDNEISPSLVELVTLLADERGYILVPTEILEIPYSGANPGVDGIRDWWGRFFDFI